MHHKSVCEVVDILGCAREVNEFLVLGEHCVLVKFLLQEVSTYVDVNKELTLQL